MSHGQENARKVMWEKCNTGTVQKLLCNEVTHVYTVKICFFQILYSDKLMTVCLPGANKHILWPVKTSRVNNVADTLVLNAEGHTHINAELFQPISFSVVAMQGHTDL